MGEDGLTINKNDHKSFIHELKKLESPKALKIRKEISLEEYERRERNIKEIGKLTYYGVHEYGDQLGRPHAHYLLFNVRDCNNIALAWAKGIVDVDPDVNQNNIDYVLKYMVKDHSCKNYENREKEVSFMSKGIGATAADPDFLRYIKKPEATQVGTSRGNKIALPRYYKKKFLTEDEKDRKNQYIAAQMRKNAEEVELGYRLRGVSQSVSELKQKQARFNELKSKANRKF